MAKEVLFDQIARQKLLVGVDQLANAVKVTPLDVKAGDRILFGKYSGTEVKIDGEDFLIMREDDILGVLEGK